MASKKSRVRMNKNLIKQAFRPSVPVINKYSTIVGFSIVMHIFTLIVVTFILNWLNKIKACKCTNIPERKFLPEWFSFLTIWVIISLGVYIAYSANPAEYPTIVTALAMIVGFINLVMIIRLFIYIRRLRDINCDCGLSQEENIIYYYLIIVFAFIAFSLLMAIIGTLFAVTT
jgi:hypothetical protein